MGVVDEVEGLGVVDEVEGEGVVDDVEGLGVVDEVPLPMPLSTWGLQESESS